MKLKLRKIGNSIGVILPLEAVKSYNIGDDIEVNVITLESEKESNVITSSNKTSNKKGLKFNIKKGIYE